MVLTTGKCAAYLMSLIPSTIHAELLPDAVSNADPYRILVTHSVPADEQL